MLTKLQILFIVLACQLCFALAQDQPLYIHQYTTDPNRTETVAIVCNGTFRDELIEIIGGIDRSVVETSIKNTYSNFQSTEFIQKLINGQVDFEILKSQLETNAGSLVVSFGFWLVPIIILIFLLPALCCCCCCPNSCPCCSGCRKDPGDQYSEAQYCCPASFIIIFSLFILAIGITSLVWRQSIAKTYSDVRCSIAILFDDLNHGNVTIDQSAFFVGIETLGDQLEKLSVNMGNFSSSMSEISPSGSKISPVMTDFDTALTQVSNIPDGSGGALTLSYQTPLQSNSPSSSVPSTFPDELGTSSTQNTLIFQEYEALTKAKTQVQGVSLAAQAFEQSTSGFQQGFSQVSRDLLAISDSIIDLDSSVHTFFVAMENNIIEIIVIVFYVIIGVIMLCALFTLTASICLCCCKSSSCRYLLYIGCFCVSLMAFICFLMAIFFGGISVISFFICDYVQTGIATADGFNTNIAPLFSSGGLSDYIVECLPSGSGNIIEKLVTPDVYQTITSLDTVIGKLNVFNTTSVINTINSGYEQVTPTITSYMKAEIIDITDFSALTKLSKASQYACTASGFTSDSWIPSITTQTNVPCQVNGGNKVSDPQCASVVNSTCSGCIDTYLMFESKSLPSEVKTDLDTRYSGCGTNFNQELANVWSNFYKPKKDTINPVKTRSQSADTTIVSIKTAVKDDIGPLFSNTLTNLQADFGTIVDPQYGLIAGLNCKMIGEDFQLFVNTFCTNTLIMSFFIQISFGIVGYFIMIISCLAVCLGVRHYRKQLVETREGPYRPTRMESAQGLRY